MDRRRRPTSPLASSSSRIRASSPPGSGGQQSRSTSSNSMMSRINQRSATVHAPSHREPLRDHAHSARRPGSNAGSANGPNSTLQLPSLPRFHPANYNSPAVQSPETTLSSPYSNPPSPGRQPGFSEAQERLISYQRELCSLNHSGTAATARSPGAVFKSPTPASPQLNPAGSPSAVTPLELDEGDSYFALGMDRHSRTNSSDELYGAHYIASSHVHGHPHGHARHVSREGASPMHYKNKSRS